MMQPLNTPSTPLAQPRSTRQHQRPPRHRRLLEWPCRPGDLLGYLMSLSPIAAFLALALSPLPSFGQELWDGTRFGMTLAQVAAAFPAAQSGTLARLRSGASNGLTISEYSVGDDKFEIDFYFRNGGLEEVVLRASEVESRPSEDNQSTFDRLVATTTDAHGRPSGCQMARSITLFRGCEWHSKDTQIDIIYVELGGQGVILNAYYRPRLIKT